MKVVSEQRVSLLLGIFLEFLKIEVLVLSKSVQLFTETRFGDFIVLVPQKEGHWLSQLGSASPQSGYINRKISSSAPQEEEIEQKIPATSDAWNATEDSGYSDTCVSH